VLEQLLSDAYWGDLDFLLLDLPPGTGDIAISLGQLIPGSEILVVTTPQIAAAEVAERAGRIAHQLKQQIIGVIENMSSFIPEGSSSKVALFGEGGGEETAQRLSNLVGANVPLLAKIPFDISLREGGDSGQPVVLTKPNTPVALEFESVIDQLTVRKKSLLGVRLGLST
jgi:ATP-binding protein involved in chromosome partitioning